MTAPLVRSETFIRATRDSGYLGTGLAVAELVDNALQASADAVDIVIRTDVEAIAPAAVAVAVIDNGVGISAENMMLALQFGGSTRFDDRRGPGRFGMGLPNASVSQARRIDLFSWSPDRGTLHTFLDADQVASGALTGVPPASPARLPDWIESRASPTGTAVLWTRCDRIPFRRPGMLVRHLHRELGRIFRRFIQRGLVLTVNRERVAPADALLASVVAGAGGSPKVLPPLVFPFVCARAPGGVAPVTVEFSLLPVRQWSVLTNEVKRAHGISGGPTVSVLRADREIASGWYLMGGKRRENYDDWWRCEISFDPYLDDLFGVSHNKQGIRPTRLLADALGPSLEAQARELNRAVRDAFALLRVENTSSAAIASRNHHGLGLREESRRRAAEVTALPPAYSFRCAPSDEPAFLVTRRIRNRLEVSLNSHHPLYRTLYEPLKRESPHSARRLELMFLALARALFDADETRKRHWHDLMKEWSDACALLLDEVRR